MSESLMKELIYDVINAKVLIKELENKILILETKNEELTNTINILEQEVNKWKGRVMTYINDYKIIYGDTNILDDSDNDETSNTIIEENEENGDEIVEDTKVIVNTPVEKASSRAEYMKEYMRNKRKKQKEESVQQINVNKK